MELENSSSCSAGSVDSTIAIPLPYKDTVPDWMATMMEQTSYPEHSLDLTKPIPLPYKSLNIPETAPLMPDARTDNNANDDSNILGPTLLNSQDKKSDPVDNKALPSAPEHEKNKLIEKVNEENEKPANAEDPISAVDPDQNEKNDSVKNQDLDQSAVDQISSENEKDDSVNNEENLTDVHKNKEVSKEYEKYMNVPVETPVKGVKNTENSYDVLKNTENLMEVEKNKDTLVEIEKNTEEVSFEVEKSTDFPIEVVKNKVISEEVAEISTAIEKDTDISIADVKNMEVTDAAEISSLVKEATDIHMETVKKSDGLEEVNKDEEISLEVEKANDISVDIANTESLADVKKNTVTGDSEVSVDDDDTGSAVKDINDKVVKEKNDLMEIEEDKEAEPLNNMDTSPDIVNETEAPVNVESDKQSPMEVDSERPPAQLVLEGYEEDENENFIEMTLEEAHDYVQRKAELFLKDPNFNPLLNVKNKIEPLLAEIKTKEEEITKLLKAYDSLNKDQYKFLRHTGSLPKSETREVGVGVDLEWLPETVSGLFQNGAKAGQIVNGGTIIRPKKPPGPIECIDLTDDTEITPNKPKPAIPDLKNVIITNSPSLSGLSPAARATVHPAPLPVSSQMFLLSSTEIPGKPRLKISVDKNGIVLQWDMPPQSKKLKVTGFEIFGYQEKPTVPVSSALWKRIGTVNPMPLPMSCTLTQFVEGFKYHFSIRGISNDILGHFSDPASIMFIPKN